MLRTIVFWFFVAGGLLNTPELQAEERYSWEQILAERRQLDDNSMTSLDKAIPEFELRIAAASNDPLRQASLYIQQAIVLQHHGLAMIEDNLTKAMPLFDPEQYPELYLRAMAVKAYGMYTYKNQANEAAELLEGLQQQAAISEDPHTQLMFLSSLIEVYYELNQFDKIPRPLFTLAKKSKAYATPELLHQFNYLEGELIYHSARIGDVKQAIAISEKLIQRNEQKGFSGNVAIIYCNLASTYYLAMPEKVKYAKASLAADSNVACSDVMQKLVLLDEVLQGNLSHVARLQQFNSNQQMPGLKERSAYYAGLAYLQLDNLAGAQSMANRMTDLNNWERYDLLQKIYEKQGNYRDALTASQSYHQLRTQKDADARALMLSSYQTRLEMAQEDTLAAEKAKQAEQLAAAEQKAEARLQLMLTIIAAGVGITIVLTLYLYRSRQLQRKLQHLSDTDPLTGLLNRRAFLHQAEQLKQLAQRQQFPLSVALIDLDFFKHINDQHGHQAGDIVLRAFANAANSTLRQTDLCGRFGGEEFILLTTQQDTAAFAASLQRLQHCFTELCVQDSQLGFAVSFSAGIANVFEQSSTVNQDIEEAIRQADEQLYRAKANGRQQVCTEDLCLQLVST